MAEDGISGSSRTIKSITTLFSLKKTPADPIGAGRAVERRHRNGREQKRICIGPGRQADAISMACHLGGLLSATVAIP